MNLTSYFEHFKATKKAARELNQSTNGHTVVEILCRDQNISANGLEEAEKTKFIADDQERILGM